MGPNRIFKLFGKGQKCSISFKSIKNLKNVKNSTKKLKKVKAPIQFLKFLETIYQKEIKKKDQKHKHVSKRGKKYQKDQG